MLVDPEGEITDERFSGIITKLEKFLKENYLPCDKQHADLRMTTIEIYQRLQLIVPTSAYSIGDVALWLDSAGFTFWDAGEMRMEWLMKAAPSQH